MGNVLFVCKYNRFRSKVAQAYFNKINSDKSIHVRSAGLIKGDPVDSSLKKFAEKFGLKLKVSTSPLSEELFRWVDIIVNVADNVPTPTFNQAINHGKKLIRLEVHDGERGQDLSPIIKEIITKVDNLVKRI
ncbi:MAG: hypothetical protein AABW73_04825 [Nanoarchaeota archaeon]